MHKGFIALHRKIKDWEWYSDTNVFRVFVHLLLSVNWQDKKWQGQTIKRGQIVIGIEALGLEIGLTYQQTRTALNKLIKTGDITSKTTNKYTLVTVINYGLYQSQDENVTNKITNKQRTENGAFSDYHQKCNEQNNEQKDLCNSLEVQLTEGEENKITNKITNKQRTNNEQVTTTKQYNNYNKENNKDSLKNETYERNKTKERKKKKPAFEIPENLHTPTFLKEWEAFVSHRIQIKRKMTDEAARRILKKLSGWGERKAIEAINESIEKSWTGVFDPDRGNKSGLQEEKELTLEEIGAMYE